MTAAIIGDSTPRGLTRVRWPENEIAHARRDWSWNETTAAASRVKYTCTLPRLRLRCAPWAKPLRDKARNLFTGQFRSKKFMVTKTNKAVTAAANRKNGQSVESNGSAVRSKIISLVGGNVKAAKVKAPKAEKQTAKVKAPKAQKVDRRAAALKAWETIRAGLKSKSAQAAAHERRCAAARKAWKTMRANAKPAKKANGKNGKAKKANGKNNGNGKAKH